MTAKEIKYEIHYKGYTISMIADVIGCSDSLISKVINRRAVSKRIAIDVAKVVGKPLHEVFPEYSDSQKR